MKNIGKYIAALALSLSVAACEEFVDNTQTVGANSKLVYVNTGADNLITTRVIHRTAGSTGEFLAEFAVRSNSPVHGAAEVTLNYDASLVEAYNAANGTAYAVLPERFLSLENATLALPANAAQTEGMMRVSFAQDADLSQLTEPLYLAPLRLQSAGLNVSEAMGVVYVAVETEVNVIRTIASADEISGFSAPGRISWSADCSDAANLFDGDTDTRVGFAAASQVVIDMKEPRHFSGISLGYSSRVPAVSIEYGLDGETFLQAGTPEEGEYVSSGNTMSVAFGERLEARYLRLRFASSATLSEADIYMTDSDAPAVYAVIGDGNLLTGSIVHKRSTGTSIGTVDAAFSVFATEPSDNGYAVTARVDNSLVAAYNAANGTSYAVLPAGNVSLAGDGFAIAAGARASEGQVIVSLTGDLSRLTDRNGYLAALTLSAQGAETSASRGTVYVAVTPETDLIRPVASADDMSGLPVVGRASWSADCENYGVLFDGDASSQLTFSQSGNDLVIDMNRTRKVTGVKLNCAALANVSFEYSSDGERFELIGTPVSGESFSSGTERYYACYDYVEARYLRVKFGFSSSWSRYVREIDVFEFESDRPVVYAQCGTDNVLGGGSVAYVGERVFNSVRASFGLLASVASEGGYAVAVAPDNSLADEFNKLHGTSYAVIDPALVKIGNSICMIEAGARESAAPVTVSLDGDLSGLNNPGGYVIPLRLFSADALVSAERGTVYVIVEYTTDSVRKNFLPDDIEGAPVADRSAWKILRCDEEGVYTGEDSKYEYLFDGSQDTFIRTWGGPVDFTVDMGREYDMTGFVITARSGNYSRYQPTSVLIECSLDGVEYEEFRTVTAADGSLVAEVPSSYMALYGSKRVRYLHIVASYGSNMGTSEFNIYAN